MREQYTKPRYSAGFFWAALFILFVGGSIALMLVLDPTYATARLNLNLTLLLTGAGVFLCLILGTADWWLKR